MSAPRLKKRFGQHHLVRSELCRPLVGHLRPRGHPVVEVGPGGGVLTERLLEAGAKVVAIELDPEWAFLLRDRCAGRDVLVAVADAMAIAWERVPIGTVVAGNLPYEIGSALIRRLLPLHARIPRLAFLVQREVAARFVAGPGTKPYGLLSVLAAAWSDAKLLGTVARGSFKPPPKVEGAFVGFSLKPPPLPEDEMPAFVRMVELAFAQRRKTLRNALASGWGKERTDRVLAAAGVSATTRAEQLSLDGFLAVHRSGGVPCGSP